MAKPGLLSKLGMAGLLALGSVTATSCKPKEPITTQAVVSPVKLDKTETSETEVQSDWKFYAEPYAGFKFALNAKDKPDPMPVYGAKIGIKKDRSGFYAGAEYGEMDESESSSAGYLDLKSSAIKVRAGAEYDLVQRDKFTLTASAGPTLTLERNEITGRVGTYEVDDSRKETIIGLEAGIGLEYKLNDRVSLTADAVYEHNFEDDNSNVTSDLTGRVGLKVKF